MTERVHCVAVTLAKPEHLEAVKVALEALIEPVHQEKGMIQYEMYCDRTEPRRFVFIEEWETYEDFEAHVHAPHIKEFLRKTEGLIEENFFHPLSFHK